MSDTVAKDSKRVTNEQLLEKLQKMVIHIEVLQSALDTLQNDVSEVKARTGFKDSPVTVSSRINCNTDPGPWGSTKVFKK